MHGIGVFVNEGDRQRGLKLIAKAQMTPVISLTDEGGVENGTARSHAWEKVHKFIATMAVKHNLLVDDSPYGINFDTGEFVQTKELVQ